MKVSFTQSVSDYGMSLLPASCERFIANESDPENFITEMADSDILCIRIGKCSRKVIEQSKELKVIGRVGVGFDSVDIAAANEQGIPVVITPGANNISVAEHSLAMIMALSKNLIESHNELSRTNWNIREINKAFELRNKTAGILGFGSVGREMAKICSGIGMHVAIYDPFVDRENVEANGYEYYDDYNMLLKVADAVSIHMPLTPETRDMISENQFSIMKTSAYIVNTGRGGIINEADLRNALIDHKIAGAALDVFCTEPLSANNPLINCPNLIITPHMAARTKESIQKMEELCIRGCLAVCGGKKWPYVADQSVYEHNKWKDAEWASM